ncbi:hypothetical protein BD311DRAFT_767928 [Dichomitus squalens]|uniref:Rad60/SUMO-like domain-containing protein n=1 Tax=Dichomitus squalens TaxID=114155 RepID=A0A4Q9MD60_9APHY|nr:hypothetical protein BD311DRAFT_767928 [Dichomitus squalens]
MSSTRPTPKPRPRPRARAPATVLNTDIPSSSSPGPSSASTSTQQPPTLSIEDEDALFLRNQTRDARAWKELSKITEEKKTIQKRKSGSSEGSDIEGGSSPRPRARKKKQPQRKNDILPDWTRKKPNEIVISSDSDDDIVPTRLQKRTIANNNEESTLLAEPRSRSITPPPMLTQFAIQRAKAAVQQLVGVQPRAPSPTEFADESTDNIVLAPELASIAQRVQVEAKMRAGSSAAESGGPEKVQIKVQWTPHPLDPNGKAEAWGIEQKRHDDFYRLFDEVADLASIRAENLVISYDGKRVFPSSTPHSIKIWATATFEAYDKVTHRYLQENKRARSVSVPPGHDDPNQTTSRARSPSVTIMESELEANESPSPPSQEHEDGSETFKLTVRSGRTDKDIILTVRPTTKCGAIVRAFLKKAGLEAEYLAGGAPAKGRGRGKATAPKVPALSVDGDRMDPETEIGEADLEDGDLVEIVGL